MAWEEGVLRADWREYYTVHMCSIQGFFHAFLTKLLTKKQRDTGERSWRLPGRFLAARIALHRAPGRCWRTVVTLAFSQGSIAGVLLGKPAKETLMKFGLTL